jgi:hypothetical protein
MYLVFVKKLFRNPRVKLNNDEHRQIAAQAMRAPPGSSGWYNLVLAALRRW